LASSIWDGEGPQSHIEPGSIPGDAAAKPSERKARFTTVSA